MFKFSQLIWRTCSTLHFKELLRDQCVYQRVITSHTGTKGSSKKRKASKSKRKSTGRKIFKTTGQHVKPSRDFQKVNYTDNRCGMASDRNATGITFTFMSYNILAQDLLELHPYLYRFCNPVHLEWKHRLSRLVNEILPVRPDVLCLQEVQHNHLRDLLCMLEKLNYDYVFKKKTGSKSDGCAILYNREAFDLLEKHTVEYYQPNVQYLDRENVALIAKLCIKGQPTSCFIASTTHLLYNPRRQDVRLAQIKLLLAELDHISFKEFDNKGEIKRFPIIVSGDFNLKPFSAPYNLITNGELVYHNLTQRTLQSSINNQSQLTGNTFLPKHLGITDNCQHYDVVKSDYKGQARIQNLDKHRLLTENSTGTSDGENDNDSLFSTGKLRHSLNLVSVYDHNNKKEATTYQDNWITVDYIFYSQYFSPSIETDCNGRLQLLSRYSLPTSKECYQLNLVIPNEQLGSDHLSLAAKFYFEGPKNEMKSSKQNKKS